MSEDIQSLNDDTKDILTEIISEINEKFQVKVKEQKIEVNQALPLILVGPNHKIKHGSSGKIVCVKFGLLNSSFSVEFVVQSKA